MTDPPIEPTPTDQTRRLLASLAAFLAGGGALTIAALLAQRVLG
jgi:hypothetical protein